MSGRRTTTPEERARIYAMAPPEDIPPPIPKRRTEPLPERPRPTCCPTCGRPQ